MYLKYKVHTIDIKMCPLTEGVPETKAGCSVWLVYKYGQRVLVKRLYVSAKLIKQTNCCEKLSDLPSFPRAGALLQVAYNIEPVQMGPINPDYAELHFIGVCRSYSRLNWWQPGCPVGHQVSSSQTGSLLWSTTFCTPPPTFLLSPTQVFLRPGWGG